MKLAGNFVYLAAAESASKVVTLAAFAYMVRVIGREGMGAIEFASAAVLCAALAVDMGFGSYGAREIAKNPDRTADLTAQILYVRLIMGVVAFLAMIGLAWWANSAAVHPKLLIVFGSSLLGLPFLLQWVFQGHEWMGAVAGLNLLRQVIFAAVVFAVLRGPEGLLVVAWAEVAGALATGILGIWLYGRWFGQPIHIARSVPREVLTHSATIGLSQILWSVKMFGATVVLGLLVTQERVGDVAYFGGAMRILVAMHAFIWLYYFNLLPAMARCWQENRAAFGDLIRASMRVIGWTAFAAGWLWWILAPTVIRVVYGDQYDAAAPVLQWMGGVALFAALSGHFRLGLIACGFQKDELATAALGAAIALVMIPLGFWWDGPVGAAIGLVAAEAVVWLSSWALATRRMGMLGHAATLVRPGVGVASAAAGAWLLAPGRPLMQAVIALALMLVAGLALDVHLRNHLRWFTGFTPRELEVAPPP